MAVPSINLCNAPVANIVRPAEFSPAISAA
jgi:hypothetical protein